SAESGLLRRRREIKELTQSKQEWAGKLALAQAALKKLEEQLSNVVNDFEGAQKRRQEQDIRVAELRKDLERAETEVANARLAVEREQKELFRLNQQLALQQEKLLLTKESLHQISQRKIELEKLCQSLDTQLSEIRLNHEGLSHRVRELQAQFAAKQQEYQGSLRQLELVTSSLTELEGQLCRMAEESEHNSAKMTESQILLEQRKVEFERLLADIDHIKGQLSQARNHYAELDNQVRALESELSHCQRTRNERLTLMNEAKLRLEQARMKEQYLVDQIRERYMVDLNQVWEKHLAHEGDPNTGENELRELKDKIARIGEVNLTSIEEYEETSKRYEFLNQQHSDLVEAKEQLRRVIDRINRICGKKFKETFDLVNDRFTKVFPVLFGGGEAHLELVEDPEKGEMGIDIIAKPPGKKMQNVSLMSGGEKALTAVALVFSIFLVRPSPYCLLDEVDAPLDDANVYRFNDLVREMAKRSQIILVTHNKHTMEVAGRLYGVTMQERGVSTMVSVNLQDLR
ncbi:MAG: chromosome segregation protein SMC, partial [Bdellovibrionaceae bacterium]|nr:chromosome segregation protein SMC [Pseudobdellovibrionaceae bacterium]